jgi:uncharacterized membrane protein
VCRVVAMMGLRWVLSEDERVRVAAVGAVGIGVGAVCWVVAPWQLAVVAGWGVAASTLVAWIWTSVWRLDAARVKTIATREDDSRAGARAVVVAACLVSLVGVVFALLKANELGGWRKGVFTAVSVSSVGVSWLAVQTVFAMRYAHIYYSDPEGGIDFPGDTAPDYHDFAYVAVTVGMTFQVSDTDISSPDARRVVLRHALISYFFGTVIVALVINVTAGLVR